MPAAFRTLLNPDAGDTDPYFSSVSLLLHMDGSNGSTTFTDSSSNAFSATVSGNAQISTTNPKFGTGAGSFDGNGDYVTFANNAAFNFGTGDFTVESWFNGTGTILGKWGSGNQVAYVLIISSTQINFSVGSAGVYSTGFLFNTTISSNTWYHVAITRSGTTLRCFLNGTQIGTDQTSSQNLTSTATVDIGVTKSNLSSYFNGSIDDVRLTKGVARYTASFTAPSAAFPDS